MNLGIPFQIHTQSNGTVIYTGTIFILPRKGDFIKIASDGKCLEVFQIIHDVFEPKIRITIVD